MKYHMRYSLYEYEEWSDKVFDTEEDMLSFINSHASNPHFNFDVIRGTRLEFRPVERVKAYEIVKP